MEKKLTTFAIIYLTIGLIFAVVFALFYHWPVLSFLSPGFYVVVFTWPYQAIGLIADFAVYGLAGKVIF